MTIIYHNPRCSKSRECLGILESIVDEFETVKYIDQPLSKEKLIEILSLLGIKPIELIRKREQIWKENFKGKHLTDNAIIQAMIDYPKLMERPIVVNGNKAIIGRPPQKVMEIF